MSGKIGLRVNMTWLLLPLQERSGVFCQHLMTRADTALHCTVALESFGTVEVLKNSSPKLFWS